MPSLSWPGCGRWIAYDSHEAGLIVECAVCEQNFTLPSRPIVRPAYDRYESYDNSRKTTAAVAGLIVLGFTEVIILAVTLTLRENDRPEAGPRREGKSAESVMHLTTARFSDVRG
jgi:hypothetical protein